MDSRIGIRVRTENEHTEKNMIHMNLKELTDEQLSKELYVCEVELATITGKLQAWNEYKSELSKEAHARLDKKKELSKKEEKERII